MATLLADIPESISTVEQLDALLAAPYRETVEMMERLPGDIAILGVSGKMGPTLAVLARRAAEAAGVRKRILGVARFGDVMQRAWLEARGVETIVCDLADPDAVAKLPRAENVIFMAGRKFGETGTEPLTWVMNTLVPGNAVRHFRGARTVVFSTGCVYELHPSDGAGSREQDEPRPVGEYANSCLGRERIFEHGAAAHGTPTLLYRLNYAIDLRYGVLVDIAERVWAGEPVDLGVSVANVIWQGDANNRALLCLEHASVPSAALNVTGPETVRVEEIAREFARLLGREARFTGRDSGKAYLSDARRSIELFGPPCVSVERMVRWVADWIAQGNPTLSKPTHFGVTNGQFLDAKVDLR